MLLMSTFEKINIFCVYFSGLAQRFVPFLLFRVNINCIKYIFRAFLTVSVLAFSCSYMINYAYLQILSAQGE